MGTNFGIVFIGFINFQDVFILEHLQNSYYYVLLWEYHILRIYFSMVFSVKIHSNNIKNNWHFAVLPSHRPLTFAQKIIFNGKNERKYSNSLCIFARKHEMRQKNEMNFNVIGRKNI